MNHAELQQIFIDKLEATYPPGETERVMARLEADERLAGAERVVINAAKACIFEAKAGIDDKETWNVLADAVAELERVKGET